MTKTPTKQKKSVYVKKFNKAKNERNRRILALRKRGLTYSEIGRKMGMSKQLVNYICRDVDKFKIKGA
jgi:DNA-binding CsgD family transcriptional regulator